MPEQPPPRQPKPRVQAPKKRASAPTPGGAAQRRKLFALAGAGFAGLALALGLFALSGGGGGSSVDVERVRAAFEGTPCTLTVAVAPQNASDHSDITSPDQTSKDWTTDPPTAGPHYVQAAVFGAYTDPLEQARVIHNLEHGGVYIQYGDDVPQETVARLQSFYDEHKPGTILAPLPRLGEEIALGAWVTEETGVTEDGDADRGRGVLARCTGFDEGAFSAFFDEFQFKGPERFDPDDLQPGE